MSSRRPTRRGNLRRVGGGREVDQKSSVGGLPKKDMSDSLKIGGKRIVA